MPGQTVPEVVESETIPEQIDDDFQEIPDVPKETVTKWKSDYGTLFRIFFLGEQYIYRNFSYLEYSKLRKEVRAEFKNDLEASDEAFKERIQATCVLWPADYVTRLQTGKPKQIPGGIPLLLGDYILAASGFSNTIVPDIIQPNAS